MDAENAPRSRSISDLRFAGAENTNSLVLTFPPQVRLPLRPENVLAYVLIKVAVKAFLYSTPGQRDRPNL